MASVANSWLTSFFFPAVFYKFSKAQKPWSFLLLPCACSKPNCQQERIFLTWVLLLYSYHSGPQHTTEKRGRTMPGKRADTFGRLGLKNSIFSSALLQYSCSWRCDYRWQHLPDGLSDASFSLTYSFQVIWPQNTAFVPQNYLMKLYDLIASVLKRGKKHQFPFFILLLLHSAAKLKEKWVSSLGKEEVKSTNRNRVSQKK